MPRPFAEIDVVLDRRADGTLLYRSRIAPRPWPRSTTSLLARWASRTPDAVFLAERDEAGRVRRLTYGEAYALIARACAWLMANAPASRPVMTLSANGIDHAVLSFAAMAAGLPYAPVSPGYALIGHDRARLAHVLSTARPGLIHVDDPAALAALADVDLGGALVCATGPADPRAPRSVMTSPFAEIVSGAAVPELPEPDPTAPAKIVFTSGSGARPKAVVHTQSTMLSNAEMHLQVWPFLERQAPVLVDWLPWSHVFGTNVCLNLTLRLGGALHVDQGKPTPEKFALSLANLRETAPTLYLNVPAGYALLAAELERDAGFRAHFLSRLDALFYAGAAMPEDLRRRLAALTAAGRARPVPLLSGWGATETGPAATIVHAEDAPPGSVGVPGPGVEIKLAPLAGKLELRVRGPGVTPGYLGEPGPTAAAFDEEGFYRSGDAGRLAVPDDPAGGIAFDGRLSEEFKLATGTWVRVGALRAALLARTDLLSEVVVCGHDGAFVAVLAWLEPSAARALAPDLDGARMGEIVAHPTVREAVREAVRGHNAEHPGSSARVARLFLLADAPSVEAGEITQKGSLNQAQVRRRRAPEVGRLLGSVPDPQVIIP